MAHVARRVLWVLCLVCSLVAASLPSSLAQPAEREPGDGSLVYHQITNFAESESGSVGWPVLSADGETAAFVDAPGTGDPANPNRIFTIGADGSGLTEVDAYQSLCFCGSRVDISADGSTVVSTEGLQVRIADGGSARELVVLASGEITALTIAGDGETVFFIVRRDTATADGAITLTRGVWAIGADGRDLRQVAGADGVAEALGVALEETGCCFHADGRPLDVADDGGQVVFGAYGGGAEHVFAVDGDGENLRVLHEPARYVVRVAISGDGATVAFEVIPLDSDVSEIAAVPFGGGEPRSLALGANSGFAEPLQLSADGSRLLVSPNGWLIETATGATRLLAAPIASLGGNHDAVLTDGLPRATMDADAGRVLYAMRTTRCADCANFHEQLATLDIAPSTPGETPDITGATIDPASIALDYGSETTVEVTVETPDTVLGVGFAALLDDHVIDANIGPGEVLLDDGQNGDAAANDDRYVVAGLVHRYVVTRDDDTGPRTVRIAVEVEDSAGVRHATALDIGVLDVGDPAATPTSP